MEKTKDIIQKNTRVLFKRNLAGSKSYRIPSMITTKKGTILVCADARIASAKDNPNKINTTIRRSLDQGDTWEDVQTIVTYPGEGEDGAAAIDTSILQDEETGTIWILFLHTPGGIGLWNSEPGVGFTEEGKRILLDTKGEKYFLEEDGSVCRIDGSPTKYFVNKFGNVTEDGVEAGNIFLKRGVHKNETLLEKRTSFLQIIRSDDDGVTWSKPIELNSQVKEPWMRFIGACPGRGLQIKKGKYKGRLVFPIYFSNEYKKMSCAVIYSDDHGETWQRGNSPNDFRTFKGVKTKAETLQMEGADLTESQVIELPNGNLKLFMRNHASKKRTAFAISQDGGVSWSDVQYDEQLLDPICQSTVINLPKQQDGTSPILFANPASTEYRRKGTVRLSYDFGEVWEYSRVIEKGIYSYSCLTVLSNGEIGLVYEHVPEGLDFNHNEIKFTKFPLEWLFGLEGDEKY